MVGAGFSFSCIAATWVRCEMVPRCKGDGDLNLKDSRNKRTVHSFMSRG